MEVSSARRRRGAKPKLMKIKVGDRVQMAVDSSEVNWKGVPGLPNKFSVGSEFIVAEILGNFFRCDYNQSVRWAPIEGADKISKARTDASASEGHFQTHETSSGVEQPLEESEDEGEDAEEDSDQELRRRGETCRLCSRSIRVGQRRAPWRAGEGFVHEECDDLYLVTARNERQPRKEKMKSGVAVVQHAPHGLCALCGLGVLEHEERLRSVAPSSSSQSGDYVHADCHRVFALERIAAARWGDAAAIEEEESLPPPPPALKIKRELTTRSRVALNVFEEGTSAAVDVATAEDLLATSNPNTNVYC
jgi:hypothetical protein